MQSTKLRVRPIFTGRLAGSVVAQFPDDPHSGILFSPGWQGTDLDHITSFMYEDRLRWQTRIEKSQEKAQ